MEKIRSHHRDLKVWQKELDAAMVVFEPLTFLHLFGGFAAVIG